jgi:hypothetical protein
LVQTQPGKIETPALQGQERGRSDILISASAVTSVGLSPVENGGSDVWR